MKMKIDLSEILSDAVNQAEIQTEFQRFDSLFAFVDFVLFNLLKKSHQQNLIERDCEETNLSSAGEKEMHVLNWLFSLTSPKNKQTNSKRVSDLSRRVRWSTDVCRQFLFYFSKCWSKAKPVLQHKRLGHFHSDVLDRSNCVPREVSLANSSIGKNDQVSFFVFVVDDQISHRVFITCWKTRRTCQSTFIDSGKISERLHLSNDSFNDFLHQCIRWKGSQCSTEMSRNVGGSSWFLQHFSLVRCDSMENIRTFYRDYLSEFPTFADSQRRDEIVDLRSSALATLRVFPRSGHRCLAMRSAAFGLLSHRSLHSFSHRRIREHLFADGCPRILYLVEQRNFAERDPFGQRRSQWLDLCRRTF